MTASEPTGTEAHCLMMHTKDGLKKIEDLSREELIETVHMLWDDLERAFKAHDSTLRILRTVSHAKGGFKSHKVMRAKP